ncbi:16S rRNA (guanine(966)-N(2))-methyltransferase RsmD [Rickettsiella endosymbiont of Dermanyssus gallinae]|uniref:16S rRNA (guanine(966)-N(2))-methyltransferase RsmD n=1 Tax=Rickettsiella endosymbiont of Dermanyssus gallinae TaxID=2856608 RepID=UPI001C52D225|nr:16S rRNA (guanine(966)-N(2))-methyltransferase RsmD [Rickettsiella endosymbiont of Dermanyssus gallinae]
MKKGQVRIIGGQWRGRKLNFPATADLRPTPNRIRETLFNWLGPMLPDAHCLDLFAGSGALGFEALSRGAKSVTFIEQSLPLFRYLKAQIKQLAVEDKAAVYHIDFPFNAARLFKSQNPGFNIVLLDPPFHKNLIESACTWLVKEKLLIEKSAIYIESEATLEEFSLAENWQISHCKTAGQVKYALIRTDT